LCNQDAILAIPLYGQRIGVAILNLVKGFGQNVEAMPVVCFTCGDSDAERKARGLPPLD
jgi:hypothetical protein